MTRVHLAGTTELRVIHRAARRVGRKESFVLALHDLNQTLGILAIPVELFPAFRDAIANLRPPAPSRYPKHANPTRSST